VEVIWGWQQWKVAECVLLVVAKWLERATTPE
jgi:hypothetical protein